MGTATETETMRPIEEAYKRLRPWTEIEACECESINGLFLVDLLTDNPLHCDFCRREVDPERLGLTAKETDAVAGWFAQAKSRYQLWLMSGEYEDYAKARLVDIDGQVNKDGREVAELLSKRIPTLLWVFRDVEDGEPTHCPRCGQPLDSNVKWGTGRCSACRIQV
jgi:hypothetical protein